MNRINDFCTFLNESPTSWHCISSVKKSLKQAGFQELDEQDSWDLKKGGSFYVCRGGSLGAFIVPPQKINKTRLVYSHTDSPALKLKPNPEVHQDETISLGVEVYGEPLLSSWLNRDLSLAGRLFIGNSSLEEKLVKLDIPFILPQLAVHLDREVNEKGLILNRQEHLPVLAHMGKKISSSILLQLLKPYLKSKTLQAFELFLYPLEKARVVGIEENLIASYRLDNLSSVYPCLEAISQAKVKDTLTVALFWDHEEIGSTTAEGATSPFLTTLLERISLAKGLDRQDYFRLLSQAQALSLDAAHAYHPNYQNKFEPQHQTHLSKGVALKVNAKYRYAHDGYLSANLQMLAKKHKLPLQTYVHRTNLPCGSTVGPLSSAQSGIPTIDLGCPLLSMHSIREIVSIEDVLTLQKLISLFFTNT